MHYYENEFVFESAQEIHNIRPREALRVIRHARLYFPSQLRTPWLPRWDTLCQAVAEYLPALRSLQIHLRVFWQFDFQARLEVERPFWDKGVDALRWLGNVTVSGVLRCQVTDNRGLDRAEFTVPFEGLEGMDRVVMVEMGERAAVVLET